MIRDWRDQAACRVHPPQWWDADPRDWRACNDRAIEICQTCPVQRTCDSWGEHATSGIWAGRDRTARVCAVEKVDAVGARQVLCELAGRGWAMSAVAEILRVEERRLQRIRSGVTQKIPEGLAEEVLFVGRRLLALRSTPPNRPVVSQDEVRKRAPRQRQGKHGRSVRTGEPVGDPAGQVREATDRSA